ncbi:hypothetical protein G6F56_003230 [Rhizopus delemar]|nr:hypothetical protein G6F56_003230 [Rhizopus delemar]
MAAISVNAIQFCATNNTKHGTNGAVFADYMTGLFNYLELEGAPDQALIMDNCRIYASSEVKQVMKRFSRHKVIFLPPWSSLLNPIEELFSKLKFFVKREHLDDTDTLLQKIREGLADMSANDCAGWISHSRSFFLAV